MSEITIARN